MVKAREKRQNSERWGMRERGEGATEIINEINISSHIFSTTF